MVLGLILSIILVVTGIALMIKYEPIPPPCNVIAIVGNARASVAFSSVPDAVSYTVTSTPGNRVVTGTNSPIMVNGLMNNVEYTFKVKTTTTRGTSEESDTSNVIIPRHFPTAPVSIVATKGSASASISFTQTDGGQADLYTVTSTPGNITQTGTSSPIVVHGLTDGISYTFKVTASDSIGQFDTSSASNRIIPTKPLYIPLEVSASPLNNSALISFKMSGEKDMSYKVHSIPGNIVASGISSPILVTGLTNGLSYIFAVSSTSKRGTSNMSEASNAIIPIPPPMAPSEAHVLTYGNGEAYIGFTSDYPYDESIVYTAKAIPGGQTASSSISPLLVSGLTIGQGYIFTVTATNPSGTSTPTYPTEEIIMT
jgi:hypothetical protein